ncbi:two-component system regulatory protein YycI [Alkalibacillus aidingensis]|uniref:two-component system regulatory protein YycI n=1 Tax=Alkalibacillus aidingensis TaxID=2747607 RepID=UPI0016614AC1|nr:two-component system regulatory protein YycI [Alkalibacillus aidingensis]
MQWGQIKTLFIVSFLILNLFLVQQFLEKIGETNLETLAQASFEDKLAAEEIKIGELPERGIKETYISAQRYELNEEDLDFLEGALDNQRIAVINGVMVVSEFIEPVNIEEDLDSLKEEVLHGDKYEYWDTHEDMMLFFQVENERPIFYNFAGVLAVELNEEGEAINYIQSILDEPVVQSEEQTVLDPIDAVDVLYSNNVFEPQDELTDMSLGYHTLVPLEEGVQIFTPTWRLTINDERTYFVNAMEGQMIPNDEIDFVESIKEYQHSQIE